MKPSPDHPRRHGTHDTPQAALGEESRVKRGTIASFRRYLNEKYAYSEPHKYGRYQQRSREYGDYLYHQDRNKFNVELQEALAGNEEYHDWERP